MALTLPLPFVMLALLGTPRSGITNSTLMDAAPSLRAGGKHDALTLSIHHAGKQLHLPQIVEGDWLPRCELNPGELVGRRVDFTVFLGLNKVISTDNVIVSTTAASHAAATTKDPIAPLNDADKRKKNKYEEACKLQNHTFIPCSFSSFGAAGKGALSFFRARSLHAFKDNPLTFPTPTTFFTRMRAIAHFTIIRWNYKNWRHALIRSGQARQYMANPHHKDGTLPKEPDKDTFFRSLTGELDSSSPHVTEDIFSEAMDEACDTFMI